MLHGLVLALIVVLFHGSSALSSGEDYEDYTEVGIDSVPTSISHLEHFLLTLSNPFRIFNRPEDQVDSNTDRFILGLPPGIREIFFAGKAISQRGFGDVMNQHRKRIQAVFPGEYRVLRMIYGFPIV